VNIDNFWDCDRSTCQRYCSTSQEHCRTANEVLPSQSLAMTYGEPDGVVAAGRQSVSSTLQRTVQGDSTENNLQG
jgi:hypothetical protein